MDQELVDEWSKYASDIGMNIRVQENKQPNKSKVYFITSNEQHGKSDRNPFMNGLRNMELILNKHIPFTYLTSSSEDRLELLAGLLDTDGHRIDETFIFTQKNERLSKDVVYLAKSLGFRVTCKKVKSSSSELVGELNSEIFKISIGGDTWRIPTRLPRKQCKYKEKARDPLNYGINVECKGFGTYYGFTLIEEPHFLLGDFTVTHNTIAGRVQMAEQLLQMNLIKSPQQYFQVMNTGRLDVMFEGEERELLLIKSENER
jgi:replicative DNA helicase